MTKLLFITVFAFGCSVNAQWKLDTKHVNAEIKDIYNYYSNGDVIARKWIYVETGKKAASSVSKHEFCTVWKEGYDNYFSFTIDDETIKVKKETKYYNTIIVMEDDSTINGTSSFYVKDHLVEFSLTLDSGGIESLKTKNIKEIQVETEIQNNIIDSKENNLDVDFIKRTSNLIWPEK
jgi:hypothetical protein